MPCRTALLPLAALALLATCGPEPEAAADGAALYARHCAACHGPAATGGAAAGAPDLTRLAARNGSVFPETRVMSVIDGYTRRDQHGAHMPEFGTLLDEDKMLWQPPEGGAAVPTPRALVALATYLETLQR